MSVHDDQNTPGGDDAAGSTPADPLHDRTSEHPILTEHHQLPAEPPTRRIHQYGLMIGLAVLVVVFAVWLVWSYGQSQHESDQNAAAANKLCRQLNNVGQPCATRPVTDAEEGNSGDAAVPELPAPTSSLTGTPLAPSSRSVTDPVRTDSAGNPQAFAPGPDALIVSVTVQEGRLVLTFDDGARVDAGPVDEDTLAIVLRTAPSILPSHQPISPPPGADAPDPTDTGPLPSTEETP